MTGLVAAVIVHGQGHQPRRAPPAQPGREVRPGHVGTPVCKSEPGDPTTETAVRELCEETGQTVKPEPLKVAPVQGAWGVEPPNGFLTVVYAAYEWTGEPENREPRKPAQVCWIDVGAISKSSWTPLPPPSTHTSTGNRKSP